ncbi:unnamed protein product [Miscanthus lutarioriparius]|uniref:Uncharacterized protein n=1 Tax=Miscanthus lutarioriparius TaxID=422564 RepID=A0A811SNG3_9POAL|nr:unnamed protein product [Miscanthus lutarioriparius]
MAATSQSTSAPLGVQLGFDGLLPRYTPLLDVLVFGCCQMNMHYKVPWPPPDRTWYAYCQVQHWGLVQKIGIHLWDSGIALSYFAVDARETHNVFESKGDVQQNPPGPPPICSCLAAHRLDILPLPWPPDPCEMIVDSGIAAYSILALTDCHCTSEAGGGVSRSFLIHTTLPPLVQSTFFSGIFQPFRNSQLSVWVTPMASMGQQVFDRGKYMEAIFMQLLLQARANPNTPAELRRLPMGLVVLCKCKDEVGLRLPKLFDKMQPDVLALLTISWPPPTWSGSSVLGTIKPFLNLHEFWQQRHVHLQFTGLPSLCISELKPRPPPTGMRNELLQVDRTSVYRSYGMLAQNTINQAAMFLTGDVGKLLAHGNAKLVIKSKCLLKFPIAEVINRRLMSFICWDQSTAVLFWNI